MRWSALFLLLAGLILSACTSVSDGGSPQRLFTNLSPGHRIHVNYESKGCFHHVACDFDFSYQPDVSQYLVRLNARDLVKGHASSTSGTVVLTRRDLADLDRVIRFYHQEHAGGSTTHDTITVEHFKTPSMSRYPTEEKFVDNSSELSDTRRTTFASLIDRVRRHPLPIADR